jgi:hypothetical protein
MTATNINIQEFIEVLVNLHENGTRLINLDMLQDEDQPSMNKLIIHPVPIDDESASRQRPEEKSQQKVSIRNPRISSDNDDIFDAFNNII